MALFEALRFLTLIPIPFGLPKDQSDYERNIARAMGWFPVAGALIGAIAAVAGRLADVFWQREISAIFAVIALAVVTAGLHLDGLSDTFDAVMSWRTRERKLEIMKDSRIGAMGAMALVAVLLLKVALLAATPGPWWAALPLAAMIGRWVDLYGIFFFPAASEGGLGANYRRHTRRRDFVFATAATALLMLLLLWLAPGGASVPMLARFALSWLCALVLAHVIFSRWTRTLGGLTGDTYGAMCEMAEVTVLAVLAAV
jgi:adenosylcobinamide-GDP ribazoletransferase